MNYVDPKTETLTVTNNDVSYEAEVYKTPDVLTGVTDESYSVWNGVISKNIDEYIIVDELKKIYRSTENSNTSFPPSHPDKWTDYGFINSYRAFASDEGIGSKTNGTDIVMEFDFSRCTTIGLIDTEFASVSVELINNDSATTISNTEINGSEFGTYLYSDYFYTEKKVKKRAVVDGLDWLPNSTLKLTFTGVASVGSILYGDIQSLGLSLVGSSLKYESRSRVQVNDITGYRTVLRYGKIRVLDASVIFDRDEFSTTSQKVDEIIDRNILWIPTTLDKFSEAIQIGYLENINLPMENITKSQTTATIIGVNK